MHSFTMWLVSLLYLFSRVVCFECFLWAPYLSSNFEPMWQRYSPHIYTNRLSLFLSLLPSEWMKQMNVYVCAGWRVNCDCKWLKMSVLYHQQPYFGHILKALIYCLSFSMCISFLLYVVSIVHIKVCRAFIVIGCVPYQNIYPFIEWMNKYHTHTEKARERERENESLTAHMHSPFYLHFQIVYSM